MSLIAVPLRGGSTILHNFYGSITDERISIFFSYGVCNKQLLIWKNSLFLRLGDRNIVDIHKLRTDYGVHCPDRYRKTSRQSAQEIDSSGPQH
ncbi:hypothetical protein NPIL_135241 [Nephila pilipes]|uniref:Uncharacterized protein n=1 Tax=Nephila pilipes TaxID=299642 RepID=A0A8X6IDT4_NEPPI|nr:hypothetical protein NPIL_135241 [Nephila pilipes]